MPRTKKQKLKGLSLFSGNGGIDLALRDYVETIGYCERDGYSQHIIASNIEKGYLDFAPVYPDVTKLRGYNGAADIILGGFPCQDLSVAGLGKGLEGKRSGLFFEVIRLTKEIRPSFVFLENVPAIRTRGLEQVIKAFTEIRYDCRWMCLSAASVGAPHKRERWFLLAYDNSERGGLQQVPWSKQQTEANSDNNGSKEFMADSACVGLQTSWPEQQAARASRDYLQSTWWSIEPNVGRVVDGLPFRVDRIKSCGNGVVPLQVKTAFETLMGLNE